MSYTPCRKCSYKNHNFSGYLHWMKSRTRSISVLHLYVRLCMGKDGQMFGPFHLFCWGMKLEGFNGLWDIGED